MRNSCGAEAGSAAGVEQGALVGVFFGYIHVFRLVAVVIVGVGCGVGVLEQAKVWITTPN